MLLLITYDVSTMDAAGKTRLRRVAKRCVDYGQRVQNSVFECLVDEAQYKVLKHELEKLIDPAQDSLHIVGFHNQRLFVNRHTTCPPIEKTAKPHWGVAV